ncbi:MAG: exodeoxyribonuclease III [Minisyncoccia bacterium]
MKIFSWNINGIRSVYQKDFLKWFLDTKAEIVCLQELKAQEEQIPKDLISIQNYYAFFNSALKKGYSGVAVYTKNKPLKVEKKIGFQKFDEEGRIIRLDFNNFILINLYLPHGGRQKENLDYKLEVYRYLIDYLKLLKDKNVILVGDFNIAHEEIDLARPKENQNNIMFTFQERKQIDEIINLGFIDTFRAINKNKGFYTWWPYMFKARERNLGWRIDYIFISQSLKPKLKNAFILSNVMGSDHCPVGIEIEIK